MLEIIVPEYHGYDESRGVFIDVNTSTKLKLEHSLVSLSKWEAKWKKPYLDGKAKSDDEILSYIKCMTINTQVDDDIYYALSNENKIDIATYINDPMTATTFYDPDGETGGTNKKEILTTELIYYMMMVWNIPMECEKWHLNRLLTLLRIFKVKNEKPKKMTGAMLAERRRLNEERKARMHTKG